MKIKERSNNRSTHFLDDCVGSYGYGKLNDTHAVGGALFGSSMSLDDCKVVKKLHAFKIEW